MATTITTAAPQTVQAPTSRPAQAQQPVGAFVQGRANEVLGQQQNRPTQTVNQGGSTTLEGPASREARPQPQATDDATIRQQQTQFLGDMRAAGIEVSNPPTQAQLRQYFATFNNAENRPRALEQFENYTNAFHVHTAETNGVGPNDVRYSPETTHTYDGRIYGSDREARRAQQADPSINRMSIRTADPSSWSDVANRPSYHGRKIQDCEGFAYMSQTLLGAAGYQVTHTNNGTQAEAHNMTVVTDPSSGNIAVTSNTRTFTGGTQQELLQRGWAHAGGQGDGGTFYTGDTIAHSQASNSLGRQLTN